MVALVNQSSTEPTQGLNLFEVAGRLRGGADRDRFLVNSEDGGATAGVIALSRAEHETHRGVQREDKKKNDRFRYLMWLLLREYDAHMRQMFKELLQDFKMVEQMTDLAIATLDNQIALMQRGGVAPSERGHLSRLLGRKKMLQRFKTETLNPLRDKLDNPPLPGEKELKNLSKDMKWYKKWLHTGFAHCLSPFKRLSSGFARVGDPLFKHPSQMAHTFNDRGNMNAQSSLHQVARLNKANDNHADGELTPEHEPTVVYDDQDFRIS